MTDTPLPLQAPTMPQSFLLSTPRAGSTLMRYIIDTHPRIASPGELGLGLLGLRLTVMLQRTLGQLGPKDQALPSARNQAAAILAGIMEAYARAKGKDQWCDKTPNNVEHLPLLARMFPQARFICLHRFALDVVQSSLEVSRHGYMDDLRDYVVASPGNLVAAMVDSWTDKSRLMLDFEEAHPDRCFRIRYEDVVLRPEEALPPLFEFLGVDWDPELPQRVFSTPHDLGAGDPKVHFTGSIDPSYIGKGKKIHYEEVPAAQRERMNELLGRLGYPRIEKDWNDTPLPFAAGEGSQAGAEAASQGGGHGETQAAAPVEGAAATDGDGPASVRQVFEEHVPSMIERNAGELAQLGASYRFVVPDAEPGSWMVDFSGAEPRVEADEGEADCVATMSSETLLAIANRRINAFSAFTEGKIGLQGQLELAYKVGLFL